LTLVTYPLVGHHETPEAKAGARKYVIYLLGAAKVFLMPAIILTYNVVGTLEFHAGGIHSGVGRQQYVAHIMEQPLLLLIIFALSLVDKVLMFVPAQLASVFEYLSAEYHFNNIARGVLDTRDLVYYASLIVLGLYFSARALQRRF
jgi:formate hydrogenlyase subunit 3/multisubunit Na+/H+ antiporter MnhD subunit